MIDSFNSDPDLLKTMMFKRMAKLNGMSYNLSNNTSISNLNFESYDHLFSKVKVYKGVSNYILSFKFKNVNSICSGHFSTIRDSYTIETDWRLSKFNAKFRVELEITPDFTVVPECSRLVVLKKPRVNLELYNLTRDGVASLVDSDWLISKKWKLVSFLRKKVMNAIFTPDFFSRFRN